MKRMLWRWLYAARFQLLQRSRYRKVALEHIANAAFVVLPEVFNPALFPTGAFLAQQFEEHIPADATVLDMGTGSGICAIFAARYTPHVTAVDINPIAVRCAYINILLNCVEKHVNVVRGDLFAPVTGRRFDVILFNPPFFRGEPQDALDHAWRSVDVVERFAASLPDHLEPGGFGLVVLSTNGDLAAFLQAFLDHGLSASVIASKDVGSEVMMVYKLTKRVNA